MKLRKHTVSSKIPIDMTPMIDCVFQLIIFFMLTLKIKADEGDFQISMPLGQRAADPNEMPMPDIKVRLLANPDGTLAQLKLGNRSLGAGDRAYQLLNAEILKFIDRPGSPQSKELEVELDPDYNLHYQEVVRAMSACSGRVDPKTKDVIRYIEKIKFHRPRKTD
jgi:biopolymer transport protein ExbD